MEFTKRPEIGSLMRTLEQSELQVRFAKNQLLPKLNANVSYQALGNEGTMLPARSRRVQPPLWSK